MRTLPERLAHRLEHRVAQVQREAHVPGIAAGVVRDGDLIWSVGVGAADVEHLAVAPGVDTTFAIGSISKTFTAALLMGLRDEGRLDLTDRLVDHLPGHRHNEITLRELLGHASGLQREVSGEAWDTLVMPSIDELVADLDRVEQVLPRRRRWHYSNLAYALLGEVAARLCGSTWMEAVSSRLLMPLGMSHTTLGPAEGAATGYFADPWIDQVHPERWPEVGAFAAAGGLWSNVTDLARWAVLLSDGADGVLAASTVDEMTRPEIMGDLDGWTSAAGLGLQLFRRGERVLVGHSGGMPGFVTGLVTRRADRTSAIVLANAGADSVGLAIELVCTVLDEDPALPAPWQPGPPPPEALLPLVGRWWSEGMSFTFSVRDGKLEARVDQAAPWMAPAVFEPDGDDAWRTVSGREEGERLLVERAADGSVGRLHWAGYPFTRQPGTFGADQ